jgi:hypothetical protein
MTSPLKQTINIFHCETSCYDMTLELDFRINFQSLWANLLPYAGDLLDVPVQVSGDTFCIKVPYNTSAIKAASCQERAFSIEAAIKHISIL